MRIKEILKLIFDFVMFELFEIHPKFSDFDKTHNERLIMKEKCSVVFDFLMFEFFEIHIQL